MPSSHHSPVPASAMTNSIRSMVSLTVLSALVALGATDCQRSDATTMTVAGATTLIPLMGLAADDLRPHGINLRMNPSGSTAGVNDTIAGRCDIGLLARDPTRAEVLAIRIFPIARDGVGIVVHANNPASNITTDQLRAIYRGRLRDWSDLQAPRGRLMTITKADGQGTLDTFLAHTGLSRAELRYDSVAADNAQVIRIVSTIKNAIGFVSVGEVLTSIEAGVPVKLLRLDGVTATPATAADGSYPMVRTLYLVTKGAPTPPMQRIIDYFSTSAGRRAIERCRYAHAD